METLKKIGKLIGSWLLMTIILGMILPLLEAIFPIGPNVLQGLAALIALFVFLPLLVYRYFVKEDPKGHGVPHRMSISMSNDAACARCGSDLLTGQGYAVYSGAYEGMAADHRVFFTGAGNDGIEKDDIERKPLSAMLYCEECADALFTEEVWKNAKALRVDMPQAEVECAEGRAARFEVIDFSIALRARRSGSTPSQARSNARALGQLWWTSPDETKRRLAT